MRRPPSLLRVLGLTTPSDRPDDRDLTAAAAAGSETGEQIVAEGGWRNAAIIRFVYQFHKVPTIGANLLHYTRNGLYGL